MQKVTTEELRNERRQVLDAIWDIPEEGCWENPDHIKLIHRLNILNDLITEMREQGQ